MRLPNFSLGLNPGTVALGAAAFLLGPTILVVARGLARSVVKAGIKGGLTIYEKGKLTVAEAKETVEDLTAEARSEISKPQSPQPAKKASRA
jgi:hypothetical protein